MEWYIRINIDYAQNIAFSTAGNLIGNKVQNKLLDINDKYKWARNFIEGLSSAGAAETNNVINHWRKDNEWIVKIKPILVKIYRNPLFDIFLLTFSGAMCCSAILLRDWLGVLFTWYPVNLFIIYCFYRKKMSKGLQETLIFIISFLYMLYIWTPLTDGTVGQMIIDMRKE